MYVVRDKKTKQILHINRASLHSKLKGKQVYAEYNSKTMEVLTSPSATLPQHYVVEADRTLRAMTLEEKVAAGIQTLPPHQKLVNGRIAPKTESELVADGVIVLREPFEYISEEGGRANRSIEQVLEDKAITTEAHCDAVLASINSALEQEMAQAYSTTKEIALMKDYLMWLDDGSPSNDPRPTAFRKMKDDTLKIRAKHRAMKDEVEALRKKLKSKPKAKPKPKPKPAATAKPKPETPTSSWTVANIKKWLTKKKIKFDPKSKKADLLKLVK